MSATLFDSSAKRTAPIEASDDIQLRQLIDEVDRPLLPGFMTAGYSALGRFIFLAAQSRVAHRPPFR